MSEAVIILGGSLCTGYVVATLVALGSRAGHSTRHRLSARDARTGRPLRIRVDRRRRLRRSGDLPRS